MRSSRPKVWILAVLTLMAVSATQVIAQQAARAFPPNTGRYKDVEAPLSPTTRFWASEQGKDFLLHTSSPGALGLLKWFHPEAVSQWPQEPRRKAQSGSNQLSPALTVTGCGTTTGTVMNLESSTNPVGQYGPSVDFILSELGSGKDLVAEYGLDTRYELGIFDSASAMYVHRDGTQQCYGGTDFEMGNPPIMDPNDHSEFMTAAGEGRLIADPNSAHKQFIVADVRYDGLTSGVGLRRIAASNLESTSTCPAGTLSISHEATCAGTNAIIVFASEDNASDTVAIAQDPRTSGTGAGDIYLVSPSVRDLRTVILISACKATFTSISDCSSPAILSGSTSGAIPSVTVVGGGPNAGAIAITYGISNGGFSGTLKYVSCTPNGAPNAPTCTSSHTITTDNNLYETLTGVPAVELSPWPQIVARTDSGGQTLFAVWSDCAVGVYTTGLYGCPEAQVVMATATSVTSPSWTLHHIFGPGHRFLPNVAYDPGQGIVNVAYYYTVSDLYKSRSRIAINQVPAGSTTPGSTTVLNTSYDSMEGDGTSFGFFSFNLGDFVGVAAHGGSASGSSRVYVGFTSNARQGTYGTVTNTQADNDILRATY